MTVSGVTKQELLDHIEKVRLLMPDFLIDEARVQEIRDAPESQTYTIELTSEFEDRTVEVSRT